MKINFKSLGLIYAVFVFSGCATTNDAVEEQKKNLFSSSWTKAPALTISPCSDMTIDHVDNFIREYYTPYTNTETYDEIVSIEYAYTVAAVLGLRSQSCIADALELKELAAELDREQKILTNGTSMSRSEIESSRKLTQRANEEIAKALEAERELKGEQRKAFAIGVTTFATSLNETLSIKESFGLYTQNTKNDLGEVDSKTQGTFEKAATKWTILMKKGARALTLLPYRKGLVNHTQSLTDTSQLLLNYALRNDINVQGKVDDRFADEIGFEKKT